MAGLQHLSHLMEGTTDSQLERDLKNPGKDAMAAVKLGYRAYYGIGINDAGKSYETEPDKAKAKTLFEFAAAKGSCMGVSWLKQDFSTEPVETAKPAQTAEATRPSDQAMMTAAMAHAEPAKALVAQA